jgi:hypothetical protein
MVMRLILNVQKNQLEQEQEEEEDVEDLKLELIYQVPKIVLILFKEEVEEIKQLLNKLNHQCKFSIFTQMMTRRFQTIILKSNKFKSRKREN